MKKTIVVNLFGGPGISKSTTAAGVFSLLKLHGVDCELVPEFAKDLTWEERNETLKNQIYIFGKQNHRLWRLNGKVDVIITDSPLLLSLVYSNEEDWELTELVKKTVNEYNNYNFLLNRVKPYLPNGRSQTEEEAKAIDSNIRSMLDNNVGTYVNFNGDFNAINEIACMILYLLDIQPKIYFSEKTLDN
jgi:hypothetical protein